MYYLGRLVQIYINLNKIWWRSYWTIYL